MKQAAESETLRDAIDELRAADPEAFTATRNALVKELKAAGDDAGAKQLTAMRRPPLPVWALNQLSRLQDPELDELFDSVDQLVAALDGDEGAPDVRESQRRYWEAVEATVTASGRVASEAGKALSATAVDQTRATLQAATTDEEVGQALLEGRLDGLHTPSGFGGVVAVDRPAASTKPASKKKSTAPSKKAAAEADAAAAAAEAAAAETARRREERDAERERERARRSHEKLVTRLVADAERRETEAANLEDEADRRERLATQARTQAEAAATAARDAREKADQAVADAPE